MTCNDRGLGPGLEAGPRLDKRGSPRGLLQSVSQLVVSWSLLVVCGCWYQNGAALFQFSFVVVLSGASCSISVVVLSVWLELPYKRCFACGSSPVVVVLCLSWTLWISCGTEVCSRVCAELGATGDYLRITNGAVDRMDERRDWTKVKQKWRPWARNVTLTSGGARSEDRGEREYEEWGAGECGVQRKDGACWRSLSTIAESGEATGEEFDFWLCCWAARVRPRRTFGEGLFCCRRFVLFCCFFLFFLSLVPAQVALGISFPFVFFSRHEDVASLLEEACVMIAVWGPG